MRSSNLQRRWSPPGTGLRLTAVPAPVHRAAIVVGPGPGRNFGDARISLVSGRTLVLDNGRLRGALVNEELED